MRFVARAAPVLAVLLLQSGIGAQPRHTYDLIIAGGTVLDGSGRAGVVTDLAIRDGRILAFGRFPRSQAARRWSITS